MRGVQAQRRRPERTARAVDRFVDRGLDDGAGPPGDQLGTTLAVQRISRRSRRRPTSTSPPPRPAPRRRHRGARAHAHPLSPATPWHTAVPRPRARRRASMPRRRQRRARSRDGSGTPRAVRPRRPGVPVNCTERVSDSAMPALRQSLGSGCTPLLVESDGEQPRGHPRAAARSPARACTARRPNTTPWCRRAGSRPRRRVARQHRVAGLGRPHTPELTGAGAGPSSSARIATASAWASASRPATTSVSASAASRFQRCAVSPWPGSGRSSAPDSSQRRDHLDASCARLRLCAPNGTAPADAGRSPRERGPRARSEVATDSCRSRWMRQPGRLESVDQLDVLAGGQRAETPDVPVGVGAETHVRAVDVIVARAVRTGSRAGSGAPPRARSSATCGTRTTPSTMSAPSAPAFTWRINQSASTTLSASVVAYQVSAGSTCAHSDFEYSNPAARAAPTLPASTEMKCTSGPNSPASPVAAVVAGVEHDDDQHRRRQAQRRGGQRAQALRADGPARCAREPPQRSAAETARARAWRLFSRLAGISHLARWWRG